MKAHKPGKPPSRSAAEPFRPRDAFRQPRSDFYRLPEWELRGGVLLTDGCRRILDFTPERICLDMGDFIVTFYGTRLRIESFLRKRLILAGRFTRIELRSKWEDTHDEA